MGEKINAINIEKYPAIKKHLQCFEPKLSNRGDKGITQYNLRNCAYMDDFEKEKIVWASVGESHYTYVEKGQLLLDTNYFAVFRENEINRYVLGLLNSKLIIRWINEIDTPVGTVAYRHYKYNFEQIPIPKISGALQQPFVKIVNDILEGKKSGQSTSTLEKEIDLMVYKLYDLTYDEVLVVEPGFNLSNVEYENYSINL